MDQTRFDRLTKLLGARISRRAGLGLLGGIGLAEADRHVANAAGKCKPKCTVCKRCSRGKCKPKPAGSPCPGGRCAQGTCRRACQSDGDCPSDGNGACRCDLPTGVCYTDVTPTSFVNECAQCPPLTVCRDYFEGVGCVRFCNA